ncbi:LysR family transcriptional regulator [Halomonas organivorans]|uniref:DNA-binding transcriptional LysR family regulator n=1 Tax=Halomonas organivorans TaxID=257772 RepID=A0A7W5BV61_9GAMM|nr:LysR family transcriptional regulator [Halomonas organivorans]MBB3139283.1 DNA-binding transcriptional LysR family regulator [Halomonas organivorans]
MKELNLRYFQSVALTGSLSAAAEDLHVAVSAVSRQITNLENRLEIKLFDRQPRGMKLTDAGEMLLAYSLRNQLEINRVISEMQGVTKRKKQTVKVACPEGMAWHFLPSAISRFTAKFPETRFDLLVVDSVRASELVKEGAVDIALTFSLSPDVGVKVVSSHDASICALMPRTHPLASRESVGVEDVVDYPLAMSLSGTTMRYLFDMACSLAGVKVLPDFSCDSLGAIYTMVSESSSMIALCSAVAVSGKVEWDGLILKPMKEPQLSLRNLQLQVMADRKLPGNVDDFLVFLDDRLTFICR